MSKDSSSNKVTNLEQDPSLGVTIEGDRSFIQKTIDAIRLLEQHPEFLEFKKYIGIIRQSEKSGMLAYATPPTYEVGNPTANYSPEWYASTIVHDGYHSYLYHKEKNRLNGQEPDPESWTGQSAERQCLTIQVQVLKKLHAKQHIIDYVNQLIPNPTYQQIDYAKRDW